MLKTEIRRREIPANAFTDGNLNAVLRRVFAARGILRVADLDWSLKHLLPVSSLEGIDAAVSLLAAHRATGRVLIVGDFDADGATSSALMIRALRGLNFAHVDYMVPDRFRFGYGLTPEIVRAAIERQPTLIVTVDNGISSIGGVREARNRGIAVLVTDHHLAGAELPDANAIVNPNLRESSFGSRCLAGVGVAFYVIAALTRHLRAIDFNPAELLDLVALGTVADVVPLDRNNRILVSQGLRRIRSSSCVPGIAALLKIAGRRIEDINAADLGFAVAPRLNAAGRLTDMSLGIECLLATEPVRALELAKQLSQLNEQRRDIELRMQSEAVEIVEQLKLVEPADASRNPPKGLCLFDPGWHQGVIGLVAGRIKDRMNCPVVAFAPALDGSLRGSARSVEGVHIRDALDRIATQNPGLVEKFGGHAMAAGLTVESRHLPAFRLAFDAEMNERIGDDAAAGFLQSDGELGATELNLDTARAIRAAGVWGQGFPEPTFDGHFAVIDARTVGIRHLKLKLLSPASTPLECITFGYIGSAIENPAIRTGARIKVLYRLEVKEYNGRESVQLNAQHLGLE